MLPTKNYKIGLLLRKLNVHLLTVVLAFVLTICAEKGVMIDGGLDVAYVTSSQSTCVGCPSHGVSTLNFAQTQAQILQKNSPWIEH